MENWTGPRGCSTRCCTGSSGSGYVESSWQSVAGERRRKYYRITESGLAELAEQRRQWDTVVGALKEIWLGPDDRRPLMAIPLGGEA